MSLLTRSLNVRLFVLLGSLVAAVTSLNTSECNCGYGGLCLDRELPGAIPCHFCDAVSRGYYVDCDDVADHCNSSPCQNGGTCVTTFGSYFCRCPEGYFGQKCHVLDSNLTRLGVTNELFVYHQVQPNEYGMSSFTVIYDALELDEMGEEDNFALMVNISTIDGRFYYPTREDEFVLEDVKLRCLRESRDEPTLYDQKICDLLPDGKVWAYRVDASTPFGLFDNSWVDPPKTIVFNLVWVAVVGYINISVVFKDLKSKAVHVLFDQTYTFLQYVEGRKIPYNCRLQVHFRGCGPSILKPTHYPRGFDIQAYATLRLPRKCRSLLLLGTSWFVQRDVFHQGQDNPRVAVSADNEPLEVSGFSDTNVVTFKPKFFLVGIHILEYVYRFRGTPPYFGAPREFKLHGRCWMKVILNPPKFYIRGGINRTASCLRPLRLTISLDDPGFSLEGFRYYAECSNASDPECASRSLVGHVLTKLNTPCRTTYHFTITVEDADNVFFNIPPIFVSVTFIESDASFEIQCWFNCHPIDRTLRVMAVATTTPYLDDPVEWRVSVNNKEIPERDGTVDIFKGSTASRLVRINGYRFVDSADDDLPSVQFSATRPRRTTPLNVTMVTATDNIWGKEPLFKFNSSASRAWFEADEDPNFKFPPVAYSARHTFPVVRLFYVEEIMTPLIRSPLHLEVDMDAPSVQLCAEDAFRIGFCTEFENLQPVRRLFTFEEVTETLVKDHDHLAFIDGFVKLVAQSLYDGNAFRQTLHYSQRRELVRLLHQVVYFDPIDVIQTFSVLSAFFYSEVGCKDLKFPVPFQTHYNKTPQAIRNTLRLRYESLKTATILTDHLHGKVKTTTGDNQSPYGSITEVFFHSFVLCYIQTQAFNNRLRTHVNNADEGYRLAGDAQFFRDYDGKLMWSFLWSVLRMASSEKIGFYGLRYVGEGDYCRLWSTLSSYTGIVNYLNRQVPKTENLIGFSDHVFQQNDSTINPWVAKHDLSLPLDLPDGAEISQHALLNFAVVLARRIPSPESSLLPNKDRLISAFMMINFMDKDGNPVNYFPHPGYNVSLPIMVNGSLDTSRIFWRDLFFTKHPGIDEEVSWFKTTLEYPAESWELAVILDSPIPLKVIGSADHLPDSDEVLNSPELKGFVKIDKGPFENRFIYRKRIQANPGTTVAVQYVGLNLPESLPPGYYRAWVIKAYPQCFVRHPIGNYFSKCNRTRDWFEQQKDNLVKCICTQFGLLYTTLALSRHQQLLVESLHVGVGTQVIWPGILFPVLLFFSVSFLVTFAVIADRRRMGKDKIGYVDTVYPAATYSIIVGVFTGSHILAGTYSRIAVQVIGELATTEVILLAPEAPRNRRQHMSSDSDTWFIVPLKEMPGEIRQIRIWHDFYCISDWYCSCILIHNVDERRWYVVEVHHWFKAYPSDEESRILELPAEEWNPHAEEKWSLRTQTFDRYYFRELRNNHAPMCLFFLHKRNVSSLEQKSLKCLAKIFAASFLSWIHLVFFVDVHPNKFFDFYSPEERIVQVNVNPGVHLNSFTILGVAAIALLTRVFVLPLHYFYRSIMLSKMVRQQTSSSKHSLSSKRSTSTRRSGSSKRSVSMGTSSSRRSPSSGKRSLSAVRSDAQLGETSRSASRRSVASPASSRGARPTSRSELSYGSRKSATPKRKSGTPKRKSATPKRKSSASKSRSFSRGKSRSPVKSDLRLSPSITTREQKPSTLIAAPSKGMLLKREQTTQDEAPRAGRSQSRVWVVDPPEAEGPEVTFDPVDPFQETTASVYPLETVSVDLAATDNVKTEDRHWCWWLWVGPTHFRSVNADHRILKHRSLPNMIKARVYFGLLSACSLTFFIYVLITSEFWQLNAGSLYFYICMALVLDALIFEPVIIFFKSLIAYAFYEVTNSPIVNAWNVNKKKELKFRPHFNWKEYSEAATDRPFHPLLSSELKKKRRDRLLATVGFLSIVYLIMLAVGCNLYYVVSSRHILSKQRFKSMTTEAESLSTSQSLFDEEKVSISDVVDYKTAHSYVTTSYVRVVTLWPNGKNISKDGRYWDLSRYSFPFSSTKMITLYYSRSALNKTAFPRTFKDLPYVKISTLNDFYEESTQETETITVNTEPVKYEVVNPWINLIGEPGTSYPLAGHTKDFMLWSVPGSSFVGWPSYFAQLKTAMEVLYTSKLFTHQGLDLEPSAIILLRNTYAPNLEFVGTLDVIIDFHPSGVSAAVLQFEVANLRETPEIRVVKRINGILAIILFAFNVFILCKVGMSKYFHTPLLVLMALFWVVCFASSFSSAYLTSWTTTLMNSVSDSLSPYLELHTVHFVYEPFDAIIVGMTFITLTTVSILILGYAFKRERLVTTFLRCMFLCLPLLILILAWMTLVMVHCQIATLRSIFPLLSAYLMELAPLTRYARNFTIPKGLFILYAVVAVILKRLFQASVVTRFGEVEQSKTPVKVDLGECGLVKRRWQARWRQPQPITNTTESTALDQGSNASDLSDIRTISNISKKNETIGKKYIFF